MNKIAPEQGAWPPPEHAMVVERSSLYLTNAHVGDSVIVELADGKRRSIRIAGTAHNVNMPPASFTGMVDGFITFETLEWLGMPDAYTSLFLTVNDKTLDRDGVSKVVNGVRDKIEASGHQVTFAYIPIPDQHPADTAVQPLLLILGVLGAMSLLLSGFLVVNTIGALLTQQTRQIGVMKTVGASTPQIVGMYLATVLIYGVLALLVAVPLGGLGAYSFTHYLADLSAWQIETTDLTELNVVRVEEGSPAVLAFDAIPGLKLLGKVSRVRALGENKQGDITYIVTIDPDRYDGRLRWNMTASATIAP